MSRNGRGFEDEARQRVMDAARRSGLSVGDLVKALSEAPRLPVRGQDAPVDRDLERRLDDLSERMRRLGGDQAAGRGRERRTADPVLDEIAATVDRLAGGTAARAAARPPRVAREDETGRILDMLEGLDRRVRALGEDRGGRRTTTETPAAAPSASPATPPPQSASRARRASLLEETRPNRRPAEAAPTEADPLDRRFRELGEKIDLLRRSDDRDGSAALISEIRSLRSFVESRAAGGADVAGEIRRLTGKIDRLAEQRPERDVVDSLATELGRLRDVVLQSNVEGSLRTIEEGYGQIVDRLDDLKRGLSGPRGGRRVDAEIAEIRDLLTAVPKVDHLSSLERNLGVLSDKFERLATREEPAAVQQIETRLVDLRAQLDRLDPSRLVVSLDQRLQAVGDKLDALERSARVPTSSDRVISMLEELRTIASGNRVGEQMRQVEERLVDLDRRIADFEIRRPSVEDTDRLHERIAEIADRLDDLAENGGSRPSGASLEAAVARLDAAIAQVASPRTEQRIDARFDELLDRLDRQVPNDRTAEVEGLTREIAAMRRDLAASRPSDDLEAQMRLLAERLDRSVAHDGDDETLGQIEEQLAHISRQLETSQDRFRDLSSLEDNILRLAERMESQHVDSVVVAREAAREMVRELAEVRRDDGGVSDTAMQALQEDLRALRSAAHDTETRTTDTLVSLHDALTGIVGRLTAIEKIAQGSARSAAAARNAAQAAETAVQAASQPAMAAMPDPAPLLDSVRPLPVAPSPLAGVQPAIAGRPVAPNPVARARELLAAVAPEDNRPLEPGSGKPAAKAAAAPTPAPASAAATPPVEAASPAAARKADFIAAARRAAQAAVATTAAPEVTAEERPATAAAEKDTTGESSALGRIGKVLKGRRRPLVLATAALVLAILTLQVIPGRKPVTTGSLEAPVAERTVAASAPVTSTVAERKSDERAPKSDETMLSKAPSGSPQVGFSMPLATDGSTAKAPEAPSTKTSDAAPATPIAPTPATPTAEAEAPATTGSIPATAATAPVGTPGDAALPETIGSADLRAAAARGDAKAAFEIGLRWAEGRRVAADPAKAVEWYEKAAAQGMAQAQYRLGIAWEKGLGVTRDTEKAKSLYKAAAEKGNVRAMHNLGVLFANARDMANAVPWFQKAADYGLRDSQFNLGIIHALGSGVKQDLAVSYKWFALAARQGDPEAEKKQNDVASHLDKVNLAAARMAVQTWVQRAPDAAANDEVRDWGDAPATAAQAPSKEDVVRHTQQLLKTKGLYSGTIDGDLGPGTKAAIRSFQKKAGLPQTGEIDATLIRALAGRAL